MSQINPNVIIDISQLKQSRNPKILMNKNVLNEFNQAQMKILKSLNKYLLTTEYLAHTIGQSQQATQIIVEDLWKKGYIDYLQSPILYIIFPELRSRQYRQASVDPTAFLTLTRRGYFHTSYI